MRNALLILALLTVNHISGQEVTTLIKNSGIDDALLLSTDGHLYGSRYQGSDIRKINLKTLTNEEFSNGYNTPNGLAFRDGWLYMADNRGNRIYRIAADGTKEVFIDNFYNPSGLLFEHDSDTLIITSYFGNKIVKAGADGNYITMTTGSQLDGPVGLCYDEEGKLYVGNFNDRLILRIDDNGDQTRIYQAPGIGSLGFITYAKGYIYGTLFNQHKIVRTDLLGNGENILGSTVGNNDGTASEAKFNSPNGIIASPSQDTLYISDFGSRNIRMITNFHRNNTATKDRDLRATINISPIPARDKVNVIVELAKTQRLTLQLINDSGQIIRQPIKTKNLSQGSHHFEIEITDIPLGTYSITIQNENGVQLTERFIRM